MFFGCGEGPGEVGARVAEAAGEFVEAEGGADGEVEALGEAFHGETDLEVAEGVGGIGKAGEFGADEEGERAVERDIGEVNGCALEGKGGDAVAAGAEGGEGGGGGGAGSAGQSGRDAGAGARRRR